MEKILTGIENLDLILNGGIPVGSIVIIAGSPGTGKTVLSQQILYHNARAGHSALCFTTVSEPLTKLLKYQQEFGFFDRSLFETKVHYKDIGAILKEHGASETLKAIERRVEEVRPAIVVIDSFKVIHDLVESEVEIRKFAYELSVKLANWGSTTFLVGEYSPEEINRVPEFTVVDGVITLEQASEDSIRFLNILKMRGSSYIPGRHSFKITQNGITVFPRIKASPMTIMEQPTSMSRDGFGIPALDELIGGGFYKGSATLVAGGPGSGKSILGLQFLLEGVRQGENGLIVSLEEYVPQIIKDAKLLGFELTDLIQSDRLHILFDSPLELDVNEHAFRMRKVIEEKAIRRVLIDSISDYESTIRDPTHYRNYLFALVTYLKNSQISSILTQEINELLGTTAITKHGTSFIVDNIILLRYVELRNELRKALLVLKVRGSNHYKGIREYVIEDGGIHLKEIKPEEISSILSFEKYNSLLSFPQERT